MNFTFRDDLYLYGIRFSENTIATFTRGISRSKHLFYVNLKMDSSYVITNDLKNESQEQEAWKCNLIVLSKDVSTPDY